MKLLEHFEKIRDEMAWVHGNPNLIHNLQMESSFKEGFDACYAHMMPLLEEAMGALGFYADRKNWERIAGHTKWASNLNTQDCAMLNCGGGRARLTLTSLKQKLGKAGA